MFDFFKTIWERGRERAVLSRVHRLRKRYWSFREEEYGSLRERDPEKLTWAELFRLHHLTLLDFHRLPDVASLLEGGVPPAGEEKERRELLLRELLRKKEQGETVRNLSARLLGPGSPYRPRHSSLRLRQGSGGEGPELSGLLSRASLFHLGSLELIRVDEEGMPREVEFVPLDSLRSARFDTLSVLPLVKIYFEYGREEEIFFAPLFFGITPPSERELRVPGEGEWESPRSLALSGDPPEGYALLGGGGEVFLLQPAHKSRPDSRDDAGGEARQEALLVDPASLLEIRTALDVEDPLFDRKCHHRGINPQQIRDNLPE